MRRLYIKFMLEATMIYLEVDEDVACAAFAAAVGA
jgi:hypothetical protein